MEPLKKISIMSMCAGWLADAVGKTSLGTNPAQYVCLSLPREWFQEIKRMMTVHSTHGLFLTCTQESHLYLHNEQLITQCSSN